MRKNVRKILQLVLFICTGALILYLVYQSQSRAYKAQCELDGLDPADCNLIDKLILDFQQADVVWIIVVYLLFILSNISRAIRWQMLLEPLGKKIRLSTGFFAIMIGYFTNLGFPRVGEVIRAGAVARYEGVKMETSIGTVVVDRIVDLVTLLVCIALTAIVEWDQLYGFLSEYANLSFDLMGMVKVSVVLLAFTFIAYLIFHKKELLSQYKVFAWFFSKLQGFIDGLLSIRKVKKPFWFVFHSASIWVCYYFMTYFGLKVLDATSILDMGQSLVAFIFGAFGFVIPSPGGMGTYHFLIMKALEIYGVNSVDGFSVANILFFSIQIGCNIFFGIISLIALPLLHKRRANKSVKTNPENGKGNQINT